MLESGRLTDVVSWVTTLITLQAIFIALGVVLERRQPAAKLAWLLVLAFVPLIGLPFYLLFGRLRPNLRRRSKLRANERWMEEQHRERIGTMPARERLAGLEPAHRALIELTRHNSGAAVSFDDSVDILSTGVGKFTALRAAIDQAEQFICMQYYIFADDATGRSVRDALCAAARRGVRIWLLVDGAGSYWTSSSFFDPLREAGAKVGVFLPIRFPVLWQRRDFRNHRKLAVIDGREAFVGGMNVANEYVGDPPGIGAWRDTHAHVAGPCVHDLLQVFMEDWYYATEEVLIPPAPATLPAAGSDIVQVVASGPDRFWPTFQQVAFSIIANARTYVYITTPYFVPDASILMAVQTAALAGVDVRVIVPARPDQRLLRAVNRSYYEDLLDAGVGLFEYTPAMIHTKTIVADGVYSLVGSANLDLRSFRLNFELGLSVISETCASRLTADFLDDQTKCEEVLPERIARRPRLARYSYALAQLASPLL